MKSFRLRSTASQLLQSLVSLAAVVALAHALSAESFGRVAVLLLASSLVMALFRTLFGEQLIAQGLAHRRTAGFESFLGFVGPGLCTLFVLAGWALGAGVYIPVALYAALTVFSDLVRYRRLATAAHDAHATLIAPEIVRVALALAAVSGAMGTSMDPWLVSTLLLTSSLVWPLLEARHLIPRARPAWEFLKNRDGFDLTMTVQFFLATSLVQATPLLAVAWYGAEDFGALRLTQTLIAPVVVLAASLSPAFIQRAAHTPANQASREVTQMLILCIGAAAAGYLVIVGSRTLWVPLLAPADLTGAINVVSVPLALVASLALIGLPGSAAIRVRRLGSISLLGQLCGLGVTIAGAVTTYVRSWEVELFAWTLAVGALSTVVATYALLFRALRQPGDRVHSSRTTGEDH